MKKITKDTSPAIQKQIYKKNNSKQLLKAIHYSTDQVVEHGFNKALRKCAPQLQTIRKTFPVNNREALVLATVVAASMTQTLVMATDISDMIGRNEWELLGILNDIESLEKKRIIGGSFKDTFGCWGELANFRLNLTKTTRQKLFSGFLATPSREEASIYSIMKEVENMIDHKDNTDSTTDIILIRVEELLKNKAGQVINAKFKKYGLSINEKILLLYILQESIKNVGSDIESFSDRFFNDYNEQVDFYRGFRTGNNILIKQGLVDMDELTINLTSKAINEFLPDDTYLIEEKQSELIMPESIKAEQLYYPEKVQNELNKIENWASSDNFYKYGKKLSSKGFCKGMTIMLNGPSGCGKTSWAYSFAAKIGYPILKLEVQNIQSRWVGKAEQRLKDAFTRARSYAEHLGKPIVILMNEGDSLLNKRNHDDLSGAGRSYNALNTIFLEELESMENIFVMTTNAGWHHLDEAYRRRFIYKVFMARPDQGVRQKIWQKYLPKFTKKALVSLSVYDLSGSEIANIIKKVTLHEIENNTSLNSTEIENMIENEKIQITRNPIGYN